MSGWNLAVNIGGSNRQENISGVAPEVLAAIVQQNAERSEEQKKLIAQLESTLDLNQRQVQAALDILNEKNIPPERLASKLIEIAEQFKALQEQIASTQAGDDARIATLKADARKAVDAGDLSQADALLAQIETRQREALDRLAANAAATCGQRGDIALTQLQYREAAGHFAKAATIMPPFDANDGARIGYLQREADALYRQGDEFGDNGALTDAIDRFKRILILLPRERVPREWAAIENGLGISLLKLGEREAGTARLEEAVSAFREALKERSREQAPREWAQIQNNLGTALRVLGQRQSGTARLKEAVATFHEVLKERTREQAPFEWAQTQFNLAGALVRLGEREMGTGRLKLAIQAFRATLTERTRERDPLQWAMTQSNLGAALVTLGQREEGTAALRESVQAFRAALMERTHERVPLLWAATQNNLSNALRALGRRESGTVRFEEAVTASRAALEEWTRERAPLEWAMTQNNLGDSLFELGKRENGIASLHAAVAAFGEALHERTFERVPLQWAKSLGAQGVARVVAAERLGDRALADDAIAQIRTAYETVRSGGDERQSAYFLKRLTEAEAIRNLLKGK
jgi:tetratricopeptide (TPR) repeat protein